MLHLLAASRMQRCGQRGFIAPRGASSRGRCPRMMAQTAPTTASQKTTWASLQSNLQSRLESLGGFIFTSNVAHFGSINLLVDRSIHINQSLVSRLLWCRELVVHHRLEGIVTSHACYELQHNSGLYRFGRTGRPRQWTSKS
jgi:hypothetical protein